MSLTEKQEAFCQAFVATNNATKAYRLAYEVDSEARPGTHYVQAWRLTNEPKLAKRIKELRAELRETRKHTLETIIDELEEIRLGAIEAGQYSAAATAALNKAKMLGLNPDRLELTGPNGGPIQNDVIHRIERVVVPLQSRDELQAILDAHEARTNLLTIDN